MTTPIINTFRVLVLAGYGLFCISCSSKEQPRTGNSLDQMTFEVRQEYLGDSVASAEAGVRFAPPKQWVAISAIMMKQFRSRLAEVTPDSISVRVLPVRVFANQQQGTSLVISTLSFSTHDSTVQQRQARYAAMMQPQSDSSSVRRAEFAKDGITITQFLLQQGQRVTYRLVFANTRSQLVQFDYILPLTALQQEIKAVESSIGSIQLF